MKTLLKIAVAEPSLILRCGMVAVLRRLSTLHIEIIEIAELSQLQTTLSRRTPDVLIVNPSVLGFFPLQQIRKEVEGLKCIALQNTLADTATLKGYDEIVSVYDSADEIQRKIEKTCAPDNEQNLREPLTEREKEIIVGVVKGLTNKQMAEQLCLSTHTVITHRRNISQKLQIHSAAGLTIYAIVNKFVDINDVKDTIHRKEE